MKYLNRIFSLIFCLVTLCFVNNAQAQEQGPHCSLQLTTASIFAGGTGTFDVEIQDLFSSSFSVSVSGLPSNSSYTTSSNGSNGKASLTLNPDRS